MVVTRDATAIWNLLNGIICVYKPADSSCRKVAQTILMNVCKDLNELDCRPPMDYVAIEGDATKKLSVVVRPSFADHPLVVGPRYQPEDFRCTWSSFLGRETSGVLILGLNKGTVSAMNMRHSRLTRAYRIKGFLGKATDTFFRNGKVVEKSTFKHIRAGHMERLLSSIQASHQKKMFELCGVDIQSQAAYDLAVQGPIRPSNSTLPVLYGIKCVHFRPPHFTIEVQCINEYQTYLMSLIHDIGYSLRSTAHCTGIQCIRHSHFDVELALLSKHWTLQNIVNNLVECQRILEKYPNLTAQQSAALQ